MADPRRALPAVEAVVEAALAGLPAAARPAAVRVARGRLAALRGEAAGRSDGSASGRRPGPVAESLSAAGAGDLRELLAGTIRPVVNATGVILQTNLGRAPLAEAALARAAEVGRGYATLEYDLGAGRRGERAGSLSRTFEALIGAPAVVVNNNAAALLLVLAALARGREVVVSRGELIEIGGSFRLPDVMRLSGARLVEVGTTNRTRAADYAEAVTPRTSLLLKVHTSNYRVVGFTESVAVADLARLARERGVAVVEDLGSGALLDAGGEPTVGAALAAGADLVCFSGDKLLGGPQAGVLAGRADLVAKLGRHPLYRALRPDKLTLAALEATLALYLAGRAEAEVPVWRMLRASDASLRERAQAWAAALRGEAVGAGSRSAAAGGSGAAVEVVEVESTIGGGALPGEVLPGPGLALTPPRGLSATRLAARLRAGDPPVVARIAAKRVILDPRTVLSEQDEIVVAALRRALSPGGG